MIADLLLPCISFEVIIYPSDPERATDLEAATLCFLRHFEDVGGASAAQLEAFIGLGDAVFQDMLIRMVNRGWVKIQPRARLILSNEARAVLDRASANPDAQASLAIRSNEEGKRVWVCYDLLGGGFAVIDRRFLLRARDDAYTVPPSGTGDNLDSAPFGLPLDGFASSESSEKEVDRESRSTEILRALQSHKWLRKTLLGARNGSVPHIHVLRPARKLTFDDVQYYKCRFDVCAARGTLESGEGVPDESWLEDAERKQEAVPELMCVEQRNLSVRRLGEQNADRIIERAVDAAEGSQGDKRFLKVLRRHAEEVGSFRMVAPDPLRSLKQRLAGEDAGPPSIGHEQTLEDILELWDVALDHIERGLASRIDFAVSRPVDAQAHGEALYELLAAAQEQVVVSSPQMRQRSPELAAGRTALGGLADLATGGSGVKVLVHSVRGKTLRGLDLSDPQAVARLVTALGVERVYVVDRALDHLRTPFVMADHDWLLWQGESIFGDRPPHGLLVRLCESGDTGSLARLERSFPPGLRERVLGGRGSGAAQRATVGASWPADVASSVRDITATLTRATAANLADPPRRNELAESIGGQIDFLARWLLTSSDCVEPVIGGRINEKASEMLGPGGDQDSLVIGISGWADSQALADLLENLSHRLARQDITCRHDIPTIVCLPGGRAYDQAAAIFERTLVQATDRFELVRRGQERDGAHPSGFIITPTSALLAQDGLVQYVPTAGRRVKGTYLGLHFMGVRARGLAAKFLKRAWPEADGHFSGQATRVERPKRVPSRTRTAILQNLARTEGWFDDGNRGAEAAAAFVRASEGDWQSRWVSHYGDARAFLEAPEAEQQALGYALGKAVAAAEDKGEIDPVGALEDLALRARGAKNLLITAVLADYLPEDSAYHDPLTRRLAYSVARHGTPSLTIDEQAGLQAPTSAALCLACLLMMDGLGDSLVDWMAFLPEECAASPEGVLARALAVHLRETGTRVIDLGHVASEHDTHRLSLTLERLRQQILSARTRQDVGLVEQVELLRRIIYERKGSFTVDLLDAIEQMPRGASEAEQTKRLLKFLGTARREIGADLYAAGQAGGTSLDVTRLAKDYFQRKNREMREEAGLELVNIEKGGRNILTSLKKIFDGVLHDLIPQLLGNASAAERALTTIARDLLGAQEGEAESELATLRGIVRDRLRKADAAAALVRPSWLLPTLLGTSNRDWATLRRAFLAREFEAGTKFHQVVNWFVKADRAGGGASEADEAEETLSLLHDLLESSAGHVEAQDQEKARKALHRRLDEIAKDAEEIIDTARAFAAETAHGRAPLVAAIHSADEAQRLLVAHLREYDLVAAVIQASDLRQQQLTVIRRRWIEASQLESVALKADLSAVLFGQSASVRDTALSALERSLRPPIKVEMLVRARDYVRLAPWFSAPVGFNEDLRLDVGEGRMPAVELGAAADLVRVLTAARNGENLAALDEIASPGKIATTVMGYFSELPGGELLALAKSDGRVWRVSCTHPLSTALSFGAAREIDLLLPLDRDSELDLRGNAPKSEPEAPLISLVGRIALRRPPAEGSPRMGRHEILLSMFISDFLPKRPVLLWRHLAQAAALSEPERRVAVLSALAQQRFASMDALVRWWEGVGSERDPLLAALLGFGEEDIESGFSEADLARHLRNLCLSLGVFVSRSQAGLALRPDGIVAAAAVWPGGSYEPEEEKRFYLSDVAGLFDKLLEAAEHGTSP